MDSCNYSNPTSSPCSPCQITTDKVNEQAIAEFSGWPTADSEGLKEAWDSYDTLSATDFEQSWVPEDITLEDLTLDDLMLEDILLEGLAAEDLVLEDFTLADVTPDDLPLATASCEAVPIDAGPFGLPWEHEGLIPYTNDDDEPVDRALTPVVGPVESFEDMEMPDLSLAEIGIDDVYTFDAMLADCLATKATDNWHDTSDQGAVESVYTEPTLYQDQTQSQSLEALIPWPAPHSRDLVEYQYQQAELAQVNRSVFHQQPAPASPTQPTATPSPNMAGISNPTARVIQNVFMANTVNVQFFGGQSGL